MSKLQIFLGILAIFIPFAFGYMVHRFSKIGEKDDMAILKLIGGIILFSFVMGMILLLLAA